MGEVQKVYKSQGVEIHDKHIELIVRQMLKEVRVDTNGDTELLPGQLVDRVVLERERPRQEGEGRAGDLRADHPRHHEGSLATRSFLSAASFQETTKVLTDAAIEGKIDRLNGLKENVIIGKLVSRPRPVSSSTGTSRSSRPIRCPSFQHPEAEAELLAALGEIGGGDGFDLARSGWGSRSRARRRGCQARAGAGRG